MTACAPPATAADPPLYRVVVPPTPPDTALMGIKLMIRSGRVYRLLSYPVAWSVNVTDDSNWTATVDAQAEVGAAAIMSRAASTMILVAAMPAVPAAKGAVPTTAVGELMVMHYGDGTMATIKVDRLKLVRYVATGR